MKVLVTTASKHGSTEEIAEAIGVELAAQGMEVTTTPARDVRSLDGFDAVVLGSAIYFGKWMPAAKDLVARERARLATVPVWLFSSGPVGTAASRPPEAADRREGDELATTIGAREHRVFAGRLDRTRLSLMERAAVRMVKAPDGDDRPWDEIRAWAVGIAASLSSEERATA